MPIPFQRTGSDTTGKTGGLVNREPLKAVRQRRDARTICRYRTLLTSPRQVLSRALTSFRASRLRSVRHAMRVARRPIFCEGGVQRLFLLKNKNHGFRPKIPRNAGRNDGMVACLFHG